MHQAITWVGSLLKDRCQGAFLLLLLGCFTTPATSFAKVTEGQEVVMNKLYPKTGRFELNGDFGLVLNQSYVRTFLAHGSINYYFNEVWGMGLEGAFGLNSDKGERGCIENFYNDPDGDIAAECASDGSPPLRDDGGTSRANFGPAYVPIRELKYLVAGNLIWNPAYGKQLIFLSATTYFDLFLSFGGGIAVSDFYPLSEQLANGRDARGDFPEATAPAGTPTPGVDPRDPDYADYIGVAGRPVPEQQMKPVVTFGFGQRYHFMKRASLKIELRNYTLLGTDSVFETFFALWGGLGVRI